MSFGNKVEDMVLNYIFNDLGYPLALPLLPIYVALWIGTPGEAGSLGSEISGGGYARQLTLQADWAQASGGTTVNAAVIVFPEATNNWGNITHFAMFDSLSGGEFLMYGPLQGAPIEVTVGSIPRFAIGTIAVTLD